jgi:hypothetical protein
MTNELRTIRRLRAWHEGRPIPRGEKVNVHVGDDDEILCLSFVRMGGESLPWAVAVGHPHEEPRVFGVPDPRDRDMVADMMVEVGRIVLEHFGHPTFASDVDEAMSVYEFRQIWVPGISHLELLHSVAFAYARTTWQRADVEVLRALGNLANCLFVDAQRPGQQTVVVASSALTTAFDFPSSPVRQAHLGHLLAWMGREKTRDSRLRAATEAEKSSVATTLDPEFERTAVQPLVEGWNAPPREQRAAKGKRVAREIADVLGEQLRHRHSLTVKTIEKLRKDPRGANAGLSDLVRIGVDKFSRLWWDQVLRELSDDPEVRAYWPGLRGDNGARQAAFSYQQRVAASRQVMHSLVHGDRDLQEEELMRGHGVRAKVVAVEGGGARWTLMHDFPAVPDVKVGGSLTIAGAPKLQLKVLSVSVEERTMIVIPSWSAAKYSSGPMAKRASDPTWRGRQLILIEDFPVFFTESMSYRINATTESGFDILDYFRREISSDIDLDVDPDEGADE